MQIRNTLQATSTLGKTQVLVQVAREYLNLNRKMKLVEIRKKKYLLFQLVEERIFKETFARTEVNDKEILDNNIFKVFIFSHIT